LTVVFFDAANGTTIFELVEEHHFINILYSSDIQTNCNNFFELCGVGERERWGKEQSLSPNTNKYKF
jgi:hypothetical protein